MSTTEEQFKKALVKCRRDARHAQSRHSFYSPSDLRRVFSLDAIKRYMSSAPGSCRNEYDVSRLATLIHETCLKTFAGLLLDGNATEIVEFLFRRESDGRIRYNKDDLYFLSELARDSFFHRQWEVNPVILKKGEIHRSIEDNEVLPFREDEFIAGGASGDVFKVSLYPDCQELVETQNAEVNSYYIARKELRHKTSGNSERAILELLETLKHPNIVEFLGSYTHYRIRNLLFPYFSMNLKQFLLQSSTFDPVFIYKGIHGVADALEKIHDFRYDDMSITFSKVGYHHDLRPDNILVNENTFVIADFGLSKLKPDDQDSKSVLRGGHDDYLGPEAFDSSTWTNQSVGRALDVWAFGCVLSEILTALRGRSVKDFREARKLEYTNNAIDTIDNSFHFEGKIRPAVRTWLSAIASDTEERSVHALKELILEMLNTNSFRRIKITDVTRSLYSLTMEVLTSTINHSFQILSGGHLSYGTNVNELVVLEKKRFNAWRILYLTIEHGKSSRIITSMIPNLSALLQALNDLGHALETGSTETHGTEFPASLQRATNALDTILGALPADLQAGVDALFADAVSETEDIKTLQAIISFKSLHRYRTVGIKASMIHMSRMISTRIRTGETIRLLDSGCIDIDRSSPLNIEWLKTESINLIKDDSRTMGYYHSEPSKQRAMIEWKYYDHRWNFESGDELLKTMDALVNLLDTHKTPRQGATVDRVLDCVGYFHQKEHYRFGFVFVLPQTQHHFNLFSMNNVIRMTSPESANRSDLGDIFILAGALASCLLAFHDVGWVHKNFSSHHVLVFAPSPDCIHSFVASALLAGFSDSRSEASTFTLGPRQELILYQHPLYQEGAAGFKRSFDFFSLGMVLLELGLWQPVSVLRYEYHSDIASPEGFRQKLISSYIPMLGERMGALYRDATAFCLDAEDQIEKRDEEAEYRWMTREAFRTRVVEPLSQCKA